MYSGAKAGPMVRSLAKQFSAVSLVIGHHLAMKKRNNKRGCLKTLLSFSIGGVDIPRL